MSNRRKIKRPKRPISGDKERNAQKIVELRGRSTAIGNKLNAKISGTPDPGLHYPNIIVADEGHLWNNEINVHLTYKS
jgi:hypothetical protein